MDTDTILRVLPLPLSLSRSWLQFDSEGLRRWIPRRPSLERGEEGGKSRTEWTGSTTSFPPTPANSTVLIYLRTFSSPFPSSFLDRCDALFPPSLSPLYLYLFILFYYIIVLHDNKGLERREIKYWLLVNFHTRVRSPPTFTALLFFRANQTRPPPLSSRAGWKWVSKGVCTFYLGRSSVYPRTIAARF